jgi:hypothetical protein
MMVEDELEFGLYMAYNCCMFYVENFEMERIRTEDNVEEILEEDYK